MLENNTTTVRLNWSAERLDLVADALRGYDGFAGRVRLQVYGESMLPTVWPGDVVEIGSCSLEDIRPGEILLAQRDGRLYLHRLIAVCRPSGFLLRGDSMPGSDPVFPSEALLGRMLRRPQYPVPQKAGVNRSFSSADTTAPRRDFGANWLGVKWSRAVGMLLCHWGVARRLALKLHGRRLRSTREFRSPGSAQERGAW